MAEVSSDISGIQRPPRGYDPTRQLREQMEAHHRGRVPDVHDRSHPIPEQQGLPTPGQPENGESPGGFQLTQTNAENTNYGLHESVKNEEGAMTQLIAAQQDYQRAKRAHESTPANSPMSFRRWETFCQAKTALGLAEIGVGSARIASIKPSSELDQSLIADWETISDGRI